jgi:predicted ATPase
LVAVSKIVLTGGPGAGKTVVAQEAVRRLGGRIVLVPEAATRVYTSLNTRWDKLDLAGRRDVQRQMYLWQVEQEAAVAAAHPGSPLLLDRGTIDGAAYWPDGADAFWPAMRTTLAAELARYDRVIFLDTAATLGLYDGEVSNDVRFESASEAIESGRLLLRLWSGHPRLTHVAAYVDLEHKIRAVVELLEREMSG